MHTSVCAKYVQNGIVQSTVYMSTLQTCAIGRRAMTLQYPGPKALKHFEIPVVLLTCGLS